MTWAPFAMLLGLFCAAVAFDIRSRRIPNKLILSGLFLAAGWQLLSSEGAWTFDEARPGGTGFTGFLFGALALLISFLPFYGFRVMGAGDVKLMAVVGGFFGGGIQAWAQLPGVALTVLTAGGLLSLLRMLMSRSSAAVFSNLKLILTGYAARASGQPGPTFDPKTDSADRMPYAIAIAIGTLFYATGKWTGWLRIL